MTATGGAGVRVIGSYISPYVRKVLVCLDQKGIPYEIDPIVPFFGNDEFTRLSPLRRVPVLCDDRIALADSTVICEYLDERHPSPPLFPKKAEDRARARWLEEFADTRMGEVFIWRIFNEVRIAPHVWKRPTDEAVLRRALDVELPSVLDFLEGELPAEGFLFGALGVADAAVASFFRNAAFAGVSVDASRWPCTAGFVARALADPSFAKLAPFEELSLRTPIRKVREALREAGAPIARESLAGDAPRPGVLST